MSAQKEPSVPKYPHTRAKLLEALCFILFYFIGYIVWILTVAISIFQFLYGIFLKNPNKNLLDFGKNLNLYLYEIVRFISFNTDTKPYPFSPWPNSDK
jgi:hypothetical protein